jgi:hypothetical protein
MSLRKKEIPLNLSNLDNRVGWRAPIDLDPKNTYLIVSPTSKKNHSLLFLEITRYTAHNCKLEISIFI